MSKHLIEFARFPSSEEAALARSQLDAEGISSELEGEAVAGWLWHFGTAVGGVRLLIAEEDAQLAKDVLGQVVSLDEAKDLDYGDTSAPEQDDQHPELPENLIRAFRSALIGMFLLPPLLNCYSMWLLIRHKYIFSHARNWRVVVACQANIMVFSMFIMIVSLMVRPRKPEWEFVLPDKPQPVYEDRYFTIPIVP